MFRSLSLRVSMAMAISIAVAIGCACGPSASEMRLAKETQYACDYRQVFGAVVDVVEREEPPLAVASPREGIVISKVRWHEPNGMRRRQGPGDVGSGDRGFFLAVALARTEAGYLVRTVPHVIEQIPGSPRGREMSRDDASWPGWADVKADDVSIKIHQRLKGCETRVGLMMATREAPRAGYARAARAY